MQVEKITVFTVGDVRSGGVIFRNLNTARAYLWEQSQGGIRRVPPIEETLALVTPEGGVYLLESGEPRWLADLSFVSRAQKREAALAKLTPEERNLLGV